jgi:ketosteroid isomerase-like protein
MFAEDGVFEFPYAPPGWPQRVEGRAAIQRYLQGLAGLTLQHVCSPTVRWVENESTVILEFSVKGRNDKTGAPYAQRYISVIELKGGLIALYRDYWNPLPVLEALGSAYSEGGLP